MTKKYTEFVPGVVERYEDGMWAATIDHNRELKLNTGQVVYQLKRHMLVAFGESEQVALLMRERMIRGLQYTQSDDFVANPENLKEVTLKKVAPVVRRRIKMRRNAAEAPADVETPQEAVVRHMKAPKKNTNDCTCLNREGDNIFCKYHFPTTPKQG